MIIPYSEAKSLLNEGDVLLFKGRGIFSRAIKIASEGQYSHAAVASGWKANGHILWECVEFREGKGGRTVSLERQVNEWPEAIDVYRVAPNFLHMDFDGKKVNITNVEFNGRCATNHMRAMTGLPYGWKRIWWIAQHKLPFLRWFYNIDSVTNDENKDLIYPVCSTAVAYSYSKCGYDLVPNRANQWTEPSDLARSALLNYLFTLTP